MLPTGKFSPSLLVDGIFASPRIRLIANGCRFEAYLLADGEKKCTEAIDTRTPNTSIFTINKEDHTLANMMRAHLLKDPDIMFAGYKSSSIAIRVKDNAD